MLHNPIIVALGILLVVVLIAGGLAWIINKVYPADTVYKQIALGILGAIVVVVAVVLAMDVMKAF